MRNWHTPSLIAILALGACSSSADVHESMVSFYLFGYTATGVEINWSGKVRVSCKKTEPFCVSAECVSRQYDILPENSHASTLQWRRLVLSLVGTGTHEIDSSCNDCASVPKAYLSISELSIVRNGSLEQYGDFFPQNDFKHTVESNVFSGGEKISASEAGVFMTNGLTSLTGSVDLDLVCPL